MHYETFDPAPDLNAVIKCYWTLEDTAKETPQKQTIVPDGCMEMIFHYGDLYRQYLEDGSSIIQPAAFVFGQLTAPLEIEPAGDTGIFAVRFQPNGFIPFVSIPLKEMENKAVPLEKLFDQSGIELQQKILADITTEARIKTIESFFLDKLMSADTIDHVVRSTVETMLAAKGQLNINELSEQININRRQLERKFAAVIGLSPKQLSKTIRLQYALQMLLSSKCTNLTDLAYEGEYYDQAHFIKDFKEFTGLTPGRFFGDHLEMSTLFYREQ